MININENNVVVIDNGSGIIKAGFADDKIPRSTFPSIVGTPKTTRTIFGSSDNNYYVGDDAVHHSAILSSNSAIEHGEVTNWENMEKILNYTIHNQLRVDPTNHIVLLTESPLNPKANREMMASIMLEKFGVPAVFIEHTSVLSLLALSKKSGLVVDSGYDSTTLVPLYNHSKIQDAMMRINIGGKNLNEYLERMLNEHGYYFRSSSEKRMVKEIKEKFCYVSCDIDVDLNNSYRNNDVNRNYETPDGNIISVRDERFRCPECLFNTREIGIRESGIHETINKSVMRCEENIRKDMYNNIVLCGGNTMFQGIDQRLNNELNDLLPQTANFNINIIAPPNRNFISFIGASILASYSQFQQICVTKSQFHEEGENPIHRKYTYL
jgi:actin-related protein